MQFVIKQLGFSIITTYIINFTKRKSSDLYISKHSLWPKTFFMRKYSLGYKNKVFYGKSEQTIRTDLNQRYNY